MYRTLICFMALCVVGATGLTCYTCKYGTVAGVTVNPVPTATAVCQTDEAAESTAFSKTCGNDNAKCLKYVKDDNNLIRGCYVEPTTGTNYCKADGGTCCTSNDCNGASLRELSVLALTVSAVATIYALM